MLLNRTKNWPGLVEDTTYQRHSYRKWQFLNARRTELTLCRLWPNTASDTAKSTPTAIRRTCILQLKTRIMPSLQPFALSNSVVCSLQTHKRDENLQYSRRKGASSAAPWITDVHSTCNDGILVRHHIAQCHTTMQWSSLLTSIAIHFQTPEQQEALHRKKTKKPRNTLCPRLSYETGISSVQRQRADYNGINSLRSWLAIPIKHFVQVT